jgi:hypothetical protein
MTTMTSKVESARRRRPFSIQEHNRNINSILRMGGHSYADCVEARGFIARCMKKRRKPNEWANLIR